MKKERNYYTDHSIKVVKKNPNQRIVGWLATDHSTRWKRASKKTLTELLEGGKLNQSQIQSLIERGVDVEETLIKAKLENLNFEQPQDLKTVARIMAESPRAKKIVEKEMARRERERTKKHKQYIRERISHMDLDTEKGMRQFAHLVTEHREAFDVLEEIRRENNE